VVEQQIIGSPGQRHEASIIGSKLFRNETGSGELIVGGGIDARRGSKRINEERGAATRRCRWTNGAVVEVQRTCENVGLPRVVALNIEYEIPRRLITVRKSSRR
jgi:hypothetical protein